MSNYLKSIFADVQFMQEFTDGCSIQYKSQNCHADVDTCRSELGSKVLIRNVYEASDSKNPDDAASGFSLKKTKRTSRSQPVSLKRLTTLKTKMDIETGWKQTRFPYMSTNLYFRTY
jgi:hypothetical protein